MMLYEVNLEVDQVITEEFELWGEDHIRQILKLRGFQGATWLRQLPVEVQLKPGKVYWTIQYRVSDRASLDHYLKNYAPKFRQEGITRFGNTFTATRRIFEISQAF